MSKGCLLEYLTGIKCNLFTIVSLIFTWFVLLIHMMCDYSSNCSTVKEQKDIKEASPIMEDEYIMNITGIRGQDVDLQLEERLQEDNKLIFNYGIRKDQGNASFKRVKLELKGIDPKQIENFKTPTFKSGLDRYDDDGIIISIPKGTKKNSIEAKIFIDDNKEIASKTIPF